MEEDKKIKKEPKKKKSIVNIRWVILLFFISLVISLVFSAGAELSITKVGIIAQILIIIGIIAFAIVFDMVGVAITTADSEVFNSMSARKVPGTTVANILLKNRDKVNSVVSDVIGDVTGIVIGSAGVSVALTLSQNANINTFISTLIVTSLIAAITISGKAFFKGIALKNKNKIIYNFSLIISIFYHPKNR